MKNRRLLGVVYMNCFNILENQVKPGSCVVVFQYQNLKDYFDISFMILVYIWENTAIYEDCDFVFFDTRNTDLRWHGSTYYMVLYTYNELQNKKST